MSVKYRTNDANAGAIPVNTTIETETQSGGQRQIVGAAFVDENGTSYGIKHVQNKPRVSAMPYLYDIAEGNVSGHTTWTKIGFTPTMTTVESDLWSKAGAYVYPTSDMQMEVISSSSDDEATGTGARQVTIYYLDGAWAEKTINVTLNGTTAVNTSDSDLYRINGFRVTAVGTGGKPAGNLSLRAVGGAVTYSYITEGYTRARNSAYTVPAGKTLYVDSFTVSYGYSTNQTHYARLYTRATQNEGVLTPGIFYPFTEVVCANTSQQVILLCPTKLVSMVDIKVSGISTFSGIASVALRGWLE